ncbi:hypothetical protein ANO11243_043510 [Dothideomycetidae sp. 11243]|nr:hypothetical protein ANO11243_043510 [fungal sp. No.11243]
MPQKRVMGHAGAFIGPRDPSAEDKFRALEQSGAVMLLTTSKINGSTQSKGGPTSQRRGYHTIRRPPEYLQIAPSARQARCLHLDGEKAASLVRSALPDFDVTESTPSPSSIQVMSTIDRISARINVQLRPRGRSDDASDESTTLETSHSPSGGSKGTDKHSLEQVAGSRESLKDTPFANFEPCRERLTSGVADFMRTHEALSMQLLLSLNNDNKPVLSSPTIHFDDSAYKSGKRQEVVFAKRDKSAEDQSEVVAEEHGIVYITLDPTDQSASIGTLVNGAGLAMNTVDVLSLPPYNVKCANFLDTGGKATSDTVKKSFELILRDSRIKVIFVNIFGGLTDCAMIADGVMLAFKDVDMRGLPVVVRLRGTNEEEGQRKIAESGLALEAFDQFEDAARRVAELANA